MEKSEFNFDYNCQIALEKKYAEIKSTKLKHNSMLSSYKEYDILIKKKFDNANILAENKSITIQRRFSDFAYIHQKLKMENPYFVLPALPAKSYLNLINLNTEEQEEFRKRELEIYINKILSIKNWDQIKEFKELFSNVY